MRYTSVISSEMNSLYKVIKVLNNQSIKYKIKGNILLHFLQYEAECDRYFRGTQDIDLSTEHKELEKLKKSIELMYPDCEIITNDEGVVKRIKNINQFNLSQIDISSTNNLNLMDEFTSLYTFKDQKFYGNSTEGIFRDKIRSISSISVSRRFKDVIDIFILKDMLDMTDDELKYRLNKYKIGNFEQYFKKETIIAKEQFKGFVSSENDITIDNIYDKMSEIIRESGGDCLEWK